jgi:hypothetical protein
LPLQRALTGLVEPLDLPVAVRIPINHRLEHAVIGTRAPENDPAVAIEELGVEDGLAARADRLGGSEDMPAARRGRRN